MRLWRRLALFRPVAWSIAVVSLIACLGNGVATAEHGDYALGAGDKVLIKVYKHGDLDTLARISAQGTINFPLIGEIKLQALTERDAEKMIALLLHEGGYVNEPQVSVIIDEYSSQRISVLGFVNRPGQYVITRGSDVIDLLAKAGGVTDDGDDVVVLTREGSSKNTAKKIDLIAILQRGDQKQNIDVVDGDVLYVPPMKKFYVYGAVNDPGAYKYERDMTVMHAISLAGGLYVEGGGRQGSESNIEIKRTVPGGPVETIKVKLEDHFSPNDIIRVKERLF